jgi:nucleoid-associated protein YgaU
MSLPANGVTALALEELSNLYILQGLLIQMQKNILLIEQGYSGQTISVNNVSLFTLAAKYYGDATRWTTIASANNLTDPQIQGGVAINIIIPSVSTNTGGLLNQTSG